MLVGRGFRGGLSQLIYHIKYQPSSTFSLLLFLVLLSLTFSPPLPFPSPPTIYISPSHLSSPFLSLLLSLTLFLSFPHTPPSALQHISEGSHLSLFFLNICHMPLHPTSRPPIKTLSPYLSHFTSLLYNPPPLLLLPPLSDLQRYNMPDNTKEPSHAKRFPYQSQQWLLTVRRMNILEIKEMCEEARRRGNRMQMELCSMQTWNNSTRNHKKKKNQQGPLICSM